MANMLMVDVIDNGYVHNGHIYIYIYVAGTFGVYFVPLLAST